MVCDRTTYCGVGAYRHRSQRACAKGVRVVRVAVKRAAVKVWVADSFNSDIPPSTHQIDIEKVSSFHRGLSLISIRIRIADTRLRALVAISSRPHTLSNSGAGARGPWRALIRRI